MSMFAVPATSDVALQISQSLLSAKRSTLDLAVALWNVERVPVSRTDSASVPMLLSRQ